MARTNDNMLSSRERVEARRRSRGARPSPATARPAPAARPKAKQQTKPATRRRATTPGPRRQAVSWVASGRIASAVLLAVSLLGLGYVFTNSRFKIHDVQVKGAEVLDQNEIVELADAQDMSIWYLDSSTIVKRLKDNPYIQDASATVALPDQLNITVVERRPEVRWASGGEQYLVDSAGRVLGVAQASGTFTNTMVIDDKSGQMIKPNDHVDTDALSLARALALRLPGELGLQPASINWSDDRGIFIQTADNRTIIFGRSDRLDEKLTVLETVLKDGTPFTFFDLRPQTPYYRNETGG